MIDAWPPVPYQRRDIQTLIKQVDDLIWDVSKVDPVSTALLGLVKTELATRKAIEDGTVSAFPSPSLQGSLSPHGR